MWSFLVSVSQSVVGRGRLTLAVKVGAHFQSVGNMQCQWCDVIFFLFNLFLNIFFNYMFTVIIIFGFVFVYVFLKYFSGIEDSSEYFYLIYLFVFFVVCIFFIIYESDLFFFYNILTACFFCWSNFEVIFLFNFSETY